VQPRGGIQREDIAPCPLGGKQTSSPMDLSAVCAPKVLSENPKRPRQASGVATCAGGPDRRSVRKRGATRKFPPQPFQEGFAKGTTARTLHRVRCTDQRLQMVSRC